MPKRIYHRHSPLQLGFSLLEVLVAMALGAFLMLAIFETFFVSARYRMFASENHARGTELANALRDMTSDLQGHSSELVETIPKEPIDSMDTRLPSRMLQQNMNFRDTFALDSHLEWKPFFGAQDYVILRTRAWTSRFSKVPTNTIGSGESLVVWWLCRGQAARVEGWRNKELSVSKTLKLGPNFKGLVRTQFFVDRSGTEREYSQVILPDAVGLKLRYFNGSELQNQWDAARMPTAIEVQLKFASDEVEHWIEIPAS